MTNSRDLAQRPSPDALLEQAERETRGRLKIFLGAAPGVGKTYEMLTVAQSKRRAGVDVVVGIAETHGRSETAALLDGLEVIPRRQVSYKERVLEEMDMDAILRRRPKLVLVDELAHTNASGSRHPKRYMDVEELLSAGINVYTTLNIQHLESLNDVVAKITRIRVREMVPDSIVDRADDVEVIDLTPEDLIQRLNEGKVYLRQQAERAVRHYFQPGNLTALRELALRRTAARVDDQMVSYMRAHAIQGPWAAGERVLVCIHERRTGDALVRSARRLADRMRAPWTAIHVETSRSLRFSETDRDRVAASLRLAQRLGGDAVTVPASDVATAIIAYAQTNNFTHVVIARPHGTQWGDLFGQSIMQRLVRRAGGISVHIMAEEKEIGIAGDAPQTKDDGDTRAPFDIRHYLGALAMIIVALGVGLILRRYLAVSNIALVFLMAVLASAIAYGLVPSLFACLVSVLTYNFFFMPPLYTFTITDPENVVALCFFAAVAVIASNLTARVRGEAIIARDRAKDTEDLYRFSRKLAGAVTLDDVLWATVYQIALMLKVRVVLLLPEGETVAVGAGYPPEDILDEADLAAAKWCWQGKREAGRGADTLPGAKRLFLPMVTARGPVGVVGLDSDRPEALLSPDQRRLFDALADQAALGIERVNLTQDVDRARLTAETERLRAALLTSISHDLRTPLASILGSATSLRSYQDTLSRESQDELIATIQDESERLNRFISNLLDMSRLESGAIETRLDLVDVSDVVGSALKRAAKVLASHRVAVDLQTDLPMLKLDPVLFEQVLFNLLDNAAKYAPADSEILIRVFRRDQRVHLKIADEGGGIPEADLERIFDMFYRVHATDRRRAGTGLGLAICRGFIGVMGGTIRAGNRQDRSGALFTIVLPIPSAAPLPMETT